MNVVTLRHELRQTTAKELELQHLGDILTAVAIDFDELARAAEEPLKARLKELSEKYLDRAVKCVASSHGYATRADELRRLLIERERPAWTRADQSFPEVVSE